VCMQQSYFLSKNFAKDSFKKLCRFIGVGITSFDNLENLQILRDQIRSDRSRQDLDFIRSFESQHFATLLNNVSKSKSQLRQDLFVLTETQLKKGGYFVEFGATDGINLSNSYLLETEFSWRGILAEPGRVWREELSRNRPNSKIETSCVWKDSNSILLFNEVDAPELSTIDFYSEIDEHIHHRKQGKKYRVQTISLLDLLEKFKAPRHIEYLSIDTEGSEFEILNAFDFNEYNFDVITVEHNYTENREKIFDLLSSKGYVRKYEHLSLFDDWYTRL